jgi:putative transposase
MKRLARRQTRYVNKQEHRTGSLWEGRYKMSIVESDSYFLECCRYIELNPVKAKIVAQPEHYWWSSYQENAGLSPPQIINRTMFKNLKDISVDHYREFIAHAYSGEGEHLFRRKTNTLQPLNIGRLLFTLSVHHQSMSSLLFS